MHKTQQLALQFPLEYGEGLQKHVDPLQKSFLFYILVCEIFYNNASGSLSAVTWSSGKGAEQPLLHTEADVGTKEIQNEVSLHRQRDHSSGRARGSSDGKTY